MKKSTEEKISKIKENVFILSMLHLKWSVQYDYDKGHYSFCRRKGIKIYYLNISSKDIERYIEIERQLNEE